MFSFASICQLYTYDEVFKDIDINEKLDRDTLINTIMDVRMEQKHILKQPNGVKIILLITHIIILLMIMVRI